MLVAAIFIDQRIHNANIGTKTSFVYRPDTNPVDLCIQGFRGKSKGCNVVILDTAGRLAMDEQLMQELIDIKTRRTRRIFFGL